MTEKIVLAFSGGLDTSYCVLDLVENGFEVHTAFIDTGGVDSAGQDHIELGLLGSIVSTIAPASRRSHHDSSASSGLNAVLIFEVIA